MGQALTKAERLAEMERLYVQRAYTDQEMAQRLRVNRSTVFRCRRELETTIPFIEIEPGRWKIDRKAYLSAIRVNIHEALILYLAARKTSRQTRIAQPYVASSLEKLSAVLAQPMAARLTNAASAIASQPFLPDQVKILETITEAWVNSRKVNLSYRKLQANTITRHLVSPYLIEPSLWSEGIYLIGYSQRHARLTTFKVDRIESAELTQETFTIPNDFDDQLLLKFAWGIWFDEEPVSIQLRFTGAGVVRRLQESIWHPSQEIQVDSEDSCLWTAQVGDWREIVPWVRGWGSNCEVLKPLELREMLCREAARLLELYQGKALKPNG